jgi:anti-sigma regulatory factor (Ser/Thr protein kinase)
VLAVNEIAANAIVHVGGSGLLTLWTADEKLICEVVDNGNGIPPEAADGAVADLLAPRGRGLSLTGAMGFSIEVSRGTGPAVVRSSPGFPAGVMPGVRWCATPGGGRRSPGRG